jgi:hypothetical protein
MRRLLCFFGRHERCKARAKTGGVRHVSQCKHCGVPMYRRMDRKWAVYTPGEPLRD